MEYDFYKDRVDAVAGFLVPGQEKYLFNLVRNLPEESTVLEIGSDAGKSATAMGFAAKEKNSKIIAVDWFREDYRFDMFKENIKKNNLTDTITFYKSSSYEFLKNWNEKFGDKKVDFVFIDASHDYQDVLSDFILSYPIVKNGGLIGFHDVIETWPGSFYAWHNFAKKVLFNHKNEHSLYVGKKTKPDLMYLY